MRTYLGFDKVADSRLGHDGNGDGRHDLLDHAGIRHSHHTTLRTNIGGYTLERHDGDSASLLGDAGLQRSA